MISRFRTFLAGFFVLLPLAVTITVIVWVGTFIYAYVGPDSTIGRILISIGFRLSDSPIAAYALGAIIVIGLIYLLGLSVFGQTDSNGTRYFMPDAQGSTRQLVDASGNIVARFAYDAYGNALGTQLGVVNPPPARILYVNQQFDTGLGYYYNRARCYATSTGRFTSMDSSPGRPVTPVTLHKYIYANADPTNGIDPSGNETLIGAMISMAIDLVVSALHLA